jgi:hypothetical protein
MRLVVNVTPTRRGRWTARVSRLGLRVSGVSVEQAVQRAKSRALDRVHEFVEHDLCPRARRRPPAPGLGPGLRSLSFEVRPAPVRLDGPRRIRLTYQFLARCKGWWSVWVTGDRGFQPVGAGARSKRHALANAKGAALWALAYAAPKLAAGLQEVTFHASRRHVLGRVE